MIKILIADDHAVVRRGVKQILEQESGLKVLGEATNGDEVIQNIQEKNWDILILDITFPDRNGLDILKEVKMLRPDLPVLILSMHPEEVFAVRALKLKAAGYVTKGSVPEELVLAIKMVLNGHIYISPSLSEKLASYLELDNDIEEPLHERLSKREKEVLIMIASGKSIKDIAEEIYLSVKTVSTYRKRILEKLNLKTTAGLIRYAIENYLVD
ncbi:MAG: response regulator transcription factor [Candidatus Dadabacteria bacterium]|nr:response regulator transcription factor [Candidatus Dadabacteria bacterium]